MLTIESKEMCQSNLSANVRGLVEAFKTITNNEELRYPTDLDKESLNLFIKAADSTFVDEGVLEATKDDLSTTARLSARARVGVILGYIPDNVSTLTDVPSLADNINIHHYLTKLADGVTRLEKNLDSSVTDTRTIVHVARVHQRGVRLLQHHTSHVMHNHFLPGSTCKDMEDFMDATYAVDDRIETIKTRLGVKAEH